MENKKAKQSTQVRHKSIRKDVKSSSYFLHIAKHKAQSICMPFVPKV